MRNWYLVNVCVGGCVCVCVPIRDVATAGGGGRQARHSDLEPTTNKQFKL